MYYYYYYYYYIVSLCDCDVSDGGYQLNSLDWQCNVVKLKKIWWTLSLCDCE